MPTLIKYIGQQLRWPELATTGNQSIWNPGQQESREDAEAALLIATGFFTEVVSGGIGVTSFAALTDKTTADLPVINGPLAVALAARPVPLTGVDLTDGTVTLTRDTHFNRQVTMTNAGAVNQPVDAASALRGDFVSVAMVGGGTVTYTTGATAVSGKTLTAATNNVVELYCFTDGTLSAITPDAVVSSTGLTRVAIVDGDFTSNNLDLLVAKTNVILDCSAVTGAKTLTLLSDSAGSYGTGVRGVKVLGSATGIVALIGGAGMTLTGGVQVIEQNGWGGAERTAVDKWAIVGQRKSGLALGSSLAQFGMCMPRSAGATNIDNFGVQAVAAIDGSTASAVSFDIGNPEYTALKLVRYTSVAATGKCAGVSNAQAFRIDRKNSQFPMVFRAGQADAVAAMPWVMGITSNVSYGTTIASTEPSNGTTDMIVVGKDTGDANMQIMHNDNAGTATRIDLGASFPALQYVAYELTLYKNDAGTAYVAVVRNMNTDAVVAKVLTSNLPRPDRNYYIAQTRSTMAQATAVALDFIGVTLGATS